MKRKKGFTLIELMAVIAILAILAAVLVPTVTGYINRSKKSAVITQVRTVVNAIKTYDLTAIDKISVEGEDTDKFNPLTTISSLVNPTTGILAKDQLLTEDDVNKLDDLTVEAALKINEDEEAVNNLQVDTSGVIESYTKGSFSWSATK